MVVFQQAQAMLAAGPSGLMEWLMGIGATLFTGYQGWQGIMLFRLQRRTDAIYTAIRGNPDIEGDRGLAGRLVTQETKQGEIEERVGTLEWHLHNTVAVKDHTHERPTDGTR